VGPEWGEASKLVLRENGLTLQSGKRRRSNDELTGAEVDWSKEKKRAFSRSIKGEDV